MRNKTIALSLSALALLCGCVQEGNSTSSSGGGEDSSGASISQSTSESSSAQSSSVQSSSDSGEHEPNAYTLINTVEQLKNHKNVVMLAKNGSTFVGYTGKAKENYAWYHVGVDMETINSTSFALNSSVALLTLDFTSDTSCSIALPDNAGYLWSGKVDAHNNIGIKDTATSFTVSSETETEFHIEGEDGVYVEYYNGSFCGYTKKEQCVVYFAVPSYVEKSDEDSSSNTSVPDLTPSEAWASIDLTKVGNSLRADLQSAIMKYKTKTCNYSACLDIGADAASYPQGSSTFVPFYHCSPEAGGSGALTTTTASCNREHTWPNSRGSGKSGPGADPFIIRPTLTDENSSRGNSFYGDGSSGTWDPASCGFEGARGEAARVILYAATAYYGGSYNLELVDKNTDSASNKTMGRLSTLLKWNRDYAPNAIEKQVNNYLCKNGYGRNPFVDSPSFADAIWSDTGVRQ